MSNKTTKYNKIVKVSRLTFRKLVTWSMRVAGTHSNSSSYIYHQWDKDMFSEIRNSMWAKTTGKYGHYAWLGILAFTELKCETYVWQQLIKGIILLLLWLSFVRNYTNFMLILAVVPQGSTNFKFQCFWNCKGKIHMVHIKKLGRQSKGQLS